MMMMMIIIIVIITTQTILICFPWFFVRTHANFVICIWTLKFARKCITIQLIDFN
jgi:hypothetical protein